MAKKARGGKKGAAKVVASKGGVIALCLYLTDIGAAGDGLAGRREIRRFPGFFNFACAGLSSRRKRRLPFQQDFVLAADSTKA